MLFAVVFAVAVPWFRFVPPPAMPPPAHSGLAPVNGVRLWYAEYGSGSPVLLLHGGLMNSNYWAAQIPALEQRHRVIVFDSRGHGRSTRGDAPFSYPLLASDAIALMNYLRLQDAAVVGWSDGAIVALEMALRYPKRVSKVFAFGANSNPSALILTPHASDRAFFQEAIRQYRLLSPAPDQFKALLEQDNRMSTSGPDLTQAQLRSIDVPTWIAAGDHDESLKRSDTDFMASQIPRANELILPGVSHFAPLQDPELFNAAVLDFLASSIAP